MNNRKEYNQIANYVYTQSEINIKIKDSAPCEYMSKMKEQVNGGNLVYGGITNAEDLKSNLAESRIPEIFIEMDYTGYKEFLKQRRILMATYIKDYYFSLG